MSVRTCSYIHTRIACVAPCDDLGCDGRGGRGAGDQLRDAGS